MTIFNLNFSFADGAPSLWLEDLFVVPEFQRKGVGKCLMQSLLQSATEQRCNKIFWIVASKKMTEAVAFYHKLGAAADPILKLFRTPNHEMETLLNSLPVKENISTRTATEQDVEAIQVILPQIKKLSAESLLRTELALIDNKIVGIASYYITFFAGGKQNRNFVSITLPQAPMRKSNPNSTGEWWR